MNLGTRYQDGDIIARLQLQAERVGGGCRMSSERDTAHRKYLPGRQISRPHFPCINFKDTARNYSKRLTRLLSCPEFAMGHGVIIQSADEGGGVYVCTRLAQRSIRVTRERRLIPARERTKRWREDIPDGGAVAVPGKGLQIRSRSIPVW